MAKQQYLCQVMTEIPEMLGVNISLDEGVEYHAGCVLEASNIDTNFSGNYSVYRGKIATKETGDIAILLNNSFEHMTGGRRPEGNKDYTTYTYTAEDGVLGCLWLAENERFQISYDAIELGGNTPVVGNYLVIDTSATNAKLKLDTALPTTNGALYLEIESLKYFQSGGLFASNFITTVVARVKRVLA